MDVDPPIDGTEPRRVGRRQRREEVERLAGLSDGHTMLFVAGDFNAHTGVVRQLGDEESMGRLEWGTRNREG